MIGWNKYYDDDWLKEINMMMIGWNKYYDDDWLKYSLAQLNNP